MDEGINICTKVLEKDPTAFDALMCRGEGFIIIQQLDAAQRDFTIAKQLHPTDQRPVVWLQKLARHVAGR